MQKLARRASSMSWSRKGSPKGEAGHTKKRRPCASCSAAQAIGRAATIGRMLIVYGMSDSGNCYKIKLALEQLGLAYRWIEVDPVKGETASAAFLAKNPNGKVPTLELENGEFLPESNAILNYLADGTPLLPRQRLARARVLQ